MLKRQFPNQALRLALIVFVSLSTFAARKERLIEAWQPNHYDVTMSLDNQLSEIATATVGIDIVAIKTLSTIDLDFGEMTTDEVRIEDQVVSYLHRNGKLDITLPKTVSAGTRLRVTVVYHGKPKDGLILIPDKDGNPSAIGDNWPNRVHHWIPTLDHPSAKATVTFNVSAPTSNAVIANGKFVKVVKGDSGNSTWTYSEGVPIPPYCMIIGVGQFSQQSPTVSTTVPLSFYVPYSDRDYAQKGFSSAGPALQMFTQTVGPYPYEKLALIVGATRFGGMENSSAIVFTTTFFTPRLDAKLSSAFKIPTGVEEVVAHEIAHQWFGDSVTESTWADLWLSEGFATYFAALFVQKYEGEEAFQGYMKRAANTAFTYEKKNLIPIHDTETEDLFKLLNGNNYQKGAWVLHMLRCRLGDEAFFRGVKEYYQEHKHATATSEDLRASLEKASGQSLRQLFDRWIYDSGHPQYELSWTWQRNSKLLNVVLTQKQEGNAFTDQVPLTIATQTGERTVVIKPRGKVASASLRIDEPPKKILIDPRNTLLKEVVAITPELN